MITETLGPEQEIEWYEHGGIDDIEFEKGKNELVKEFKVGDKRVAGSIDALHATVPSDKEVYELVLRENPDVKDIGNIASDIIDDINQRSQKIKEQKPELIHKRILSEIQKDIDGDELYNRILHLKKLYEQGTEEIARIGSEIARSTFLIPSSRIKEDWNRPEDAKDISNKAGKPLEGSFRAHLVEKRLYTEAMREQGLLNESDDLIKPYVHFSIHGCAKFKGGSDIFIANGIKDGGHLPCDPEIARWVKKKVEDKIRSKKLFNSRKELLKVHVSIEDQRLSGSTASVRRRCGTNSVIKGWGNSYQYIQFEIGPYSRSFYRQEFGEIIGGLVNEFNQEFPLKENLDDFIKQKETKIDKKRKEGQLYIRKPMVSDKINPGLLGLSSDCRNALGAEGGENVNVEFVDNEFNVIEKKTLKAVNTHYKFKMRYVTFPNELGELAQNRIFLNKESNEKY